MNNLIKKILIEWSYRLDDGMINLENNKHISILREVLSEMKISSEVIIEVIGNLTEEQEFKARSKETNKIVYYKSKENMDNAIKDGTAIPLDKEASDEPEKVKGQDMFAKDLEKKKEKEDRTSDSDEEKEKEKQDFLIDIANSLLLQSTEESGVGRFNMSKEDLKTYQDYLKGEKPKMPNYDINDVEVNRVIGVLKSTLGENYQNMVQRVKRKGDPPKEYSRGEKGQKRFFEAIRHYMTTGGKSSITGQVVPFSETQLDHIVSLDNGGTDGPENWEWMESRFNQFKGALSDEQVMEKINKELEKSPEEDKLKTLEQSFKKYAKQAQINYYSKKFKEGGTAGLTEESINNLTGPNLSAVIKGWNESNPEDTEFFIPRYGTTKDRKSGRASGGRLAPKPVLIERVMEQMKASGLDVPSKSETQAIDKDFQVIVDELEKQKGDIAKLKQKIKSRDK